MTFVYGNDENITLILTQDELNILELLLGFTLGASARLNETGVHKLAMSFITLMNEARLKDITTEIEDLKTDDK